MSTNAGKFAICNQKGELLSSVIFAHAPTAKAHFEGIGERIAAEEGLSEAEAPSIEWLEIEPPEWANSRMTAWAGYMEDGTENPVIIAGLSVEERSLAAGA